MGIKQSSTKSKDENLASWTDAKLLGALRDVANVRDDDGASRFLRQSPEFLRASKSRFEIPETRVRLLTMLLAEIWRGTSVGASILLALLVVDDLDEAILSAVRFYPTQQRDGWNIGPAALAPVPLTNIENHFRLVWARQGQFRYEPTTALQKAVYVLWAKSSLAKVCRNPDCPAPFFIGRRIQQQYCGDECAAPFRLEAKNKWWNTVGKKRREEKTLKASKKRGKR